MAHISNTHATQNINPLESDARSDSSTSSTNNTGPLYVTLSEYIEQHAGSDDAHRSISVGAGPAGAAKEAAFWNTMRQKSSDINDLSSKGAKYQAESILIDSKSSNNTARGNAWDDEQGYGTVNTAPELAEGHKGRLANFYNEERGDLQKEYDQKNPIAGWTLASAYESPEGAAGKPTVGRAAITRKDQGREEHAHFNQEAARIVKEFPFYKLSVISEATVDKIDISDRNRPKVLVRQNHSNKTHALQAQGVAMNIGTPLRNPIRDPNVKRLTFCQAMDPGKIADFAREHELLDDKGVLKSGVKLGSGGTSLSQYDQLIGMNTIMNFMKRTDDGYAISPEAAKKYQGAIVVISNTPGKWVPPRHSNSAEWTQEKNALGTPEELHAMLLHEDGHELYEAWSHIAVASVANTLNITPEQVSQSGLSTAELLHAQGASTKEHIAKLAEASNLTGTEREQALRQATQTLEGARREAFLSSMLGFGMAADIPATIERMEKLAPLTYAGRSGYLIERAQAAGVTAPDVASVKDNRATMSTLTNMNNDIIASPFRVHLLAVKLQEAGIMKYVAGGYEDLKAGPADKQISFKGRNSDTTEKLDAFFVSPTFDRKQSGPLNSLEGQVKPIHPLVPDLAAVAPNHLMLTPTGETVQVQDYSVARTGSTHPVTKSKIGLDAFDVNNRDSVYDVAPGQALRRLAKIHLHAVGLESADKIEELYKKHASVSTDDYRAEVAKFAEHFKTGKDKEAFLKAMAAAVKEAPDMQNKGDVFGIPTELFARSTAGREAAVIVGKHFADNPNVFSDPRENNFAQAMAAFKEERGEKGAKLPPFNPSGKEAFFNRFIDYPMSVHEAVYAEAVQLAQDQLKHKVRRTPAIRSLAVATTQTAASAARAAQASDDSDAS